MDGKRREMSQGGQATVLVAVAVALVAVVALGLTRIGVAVLARARAQSAADAAALAAAGEGPAAGAAGRRVAEQVTADNHGHLRSFTVQGRDVVVAVEVSGEQATARARAAPPGG